MTLFYKSILVRKTTKNIFVSTSGSNFNNIGTSTSVQKSYYRTNFIESNIEEDIEMKNFLRNKIPKVPSTIREEASKKYVDT